MEQMEKSEDRLLDLKHDIRNPLYIAKSLIETHLEELNGSPDETAASVPANNTKVVLEKAVTEISRVLQAIQRLNQIAKKVCDIKPPEEKSRCICVREVLNPIIAALKKGGYLEHLILIESIPSGLPEIKADPIDLEEVFFNLIVNAAQATMPGGRLVIEASLQALPVPTIMVSFEDTGCGIPDEALPHIFEPFYTGRSEEGGVGFGLFIVRQLVERNGGQITVESERDGGTTFTLAFPLEEFAKKPKT